jgi:glycine/D-amino acid oxidase-like deaminating enzyme
MNATVRADFGASWYASRADGTEAGAFERAPLTYDIDVDVCVIGGGLAGLTAAREVARRGWSVAVLEARRVGWSASGRNAGFVVPGFGTDPRAMVDRVGMDNARELWKLSEAGVDYVRAAIRDAAMPGVEPVDGWLDVSKTDKGDEALAVASLLGQDFGASIEGWPAEKVRAALKTDFYFHAIHYPTAFHIDPLAYVRGLARAAIAAGVVIFEETPALSIDPAGVRKRIATPKGRVRAAHIVLAANAHLGSLVPGLADTVLPVTAYVAVTTPLGDRLGEAIAWRGAVSDTRLADHHYRVVGGDRLMWAGAGGLWPRGPRGAARQFQSAIARIFPQLGAVDFEHAWSGAMAFSLHGMPQVGEVIPGLWLANGFGAHGLNTTALAGELIAGAITERDDRWRLLLPYELVWAGGRFGQLVRHVGVWSLGRGEDWTAGVARRREAVRRAEPESAPVSVSPAAEAAPVPPANTVEIDVPEVEALLREAADRAKHEHPHGLEAPPHEADAPSGEDVPPLRRNPPYS